MDKYHFFEQLYVKSSEVQFNLENTGRLNYLFGGSENTLSIKAICTVSAADYTLWVGDKLWNKCEVPQKRNIHSPAFFNMNSNLWVSKAL